MKKQERSNKKSVYIYSHDYRMKKYKKLTFFFSFYNLITVTTKLANIFY